jgi:hypothetical protein
MKQFQVYCFEQWVASVGGPAAAAALMGIQQTQVNRWVDAGALLAKDGTVFPPTSANYVRNKVEVENETQNN